MGASFIGRKKMRLARFDIACDSSLYISLNGITVRLYAKGLMEKILFFP